VDFCIAKGIPQDFALAKPCFNLSSGHSPVIATLSTQALKQDKQPGLCNRCTNWDDFRHLINKRLTLNVPLKTEEETEAAVKFFNDTIQWAGWNAMPEHTDTFKTYQCPLLIKQKITERKILCRCWYQLRTPDSKRLFNAAIQELKQLLISNQNNSIQTFLQGHTPTESTDYSCGRRLRK
jgi:hypothetical protein